MCCLSVLSSAWYELDMSSTNAFKNLGLENKFNYSLRISVYIRVLIVVLFLV